jgi:hypothetical protein
MKWNDVIEMKTALCIQGYRAFVPEEHVMSISIGSRARVLKEHPVGSKARHHYFFAHVPKERTIL